MNWKSFWEGIKISFDIGFKLLNIIVYFGSLILSIVSSYNHDMTTAVYFLIFTVLSYLFMQSDLNADKFEKLNEKLDKYYSVDDYEELLDDVEETLDWARRSFVQTTPSLSQDDALALASYLNEVRKVIRKDDFR